MVEKKMAETAAKTGIVKQEPAKVAVVPKKKEAEKPEAVKAEEPKAEAVKEETKKAAEAPAAEPVKKEETKKTAVKKTTAAKKTAAKKETAEAAPKTAAKAATTKTAAAKTAKTTAAKAAPAKTAAKKTTAKAKKEAETTVVLQFAGKEIYAKDLMAKAKADWVAAGHKEEDLKDITLYVKPEEFAAYYVANGIDTGSVDL